MELGDRLRQRRELRDFAGALRSAPAFIVSPSDPPRKALKSMPLPLASIQSDPLGVDARQLLNRHAAFRSAIQHRADEVERTCAEHQMRKKERSFFT
jgi:hypothetical protein